MHFMISDFVIGNLAGFDVRVYMKITVYQNMRISEFTDRGYSSEFVKAGFQEQIGSEYERYILWSIHSLGFW